MTESRDKANREALRHLTEADPTLEDILPAGEAMPGMAANMVLTSGPRMAWADYTGGQREAVIGGALFEGLAADRDDALAKIDSGEIVVDGCHDHGAVGSLAGIYTASMPVFVVRNRAGGNVGYCNFYEGTNPRRLNYGVYDDGVKERLDYVHAVVAPPIRDAVRAAGGIPLKPIMKRALHMGDELHSRNTAASLLFTRELFPHLLTIAETDSEGVRRAVEALTEDHYFFLRLSMASAKAIADAARDVEGSSLVTAMGFNCKGFYIRVSGLGDTWFEGPHPTVHAKLFDGHTEDEISWMGGESTIAETVGLGGFAQACAFPLQAYQGGSAEAMVAQNLEMYEITLGESPDFHIPFLGYRGTPTGIDIFKVLETGITPVMDIGIAGKDGGQIGAGLVRAHPGCFEAAAAAYRDRYGA
ncbi:MAG: DUF1116 domain-containing protein [Rhodospirillaceae bacterium]|jgi:hypothetical protein|nr:DUF1116 domain-containing protein [Rhodospirillaceae bacterium]